MPRRSIAGSIALCALPLAMSACDRAVADDPRTAAPLVRTAVVRTAEPAPREFTGVVVARVQSDLGFRISGKVVERLVDAGQTVRRGQALMRIDSTDLKLAADAQEEAVESAEARAEQAEEQSDRYRELRDHGEVSDSEYAAIKAAEDAADADVEAAEDQADLARNSSRYAELVADSDGVVVETLAEPGQVVSAGQLVVRLAKGGPREAAIQLPETLRPKIGSIGQATLYGAEGVTFPTKLRQLSSAADRLTRTFEARYVLEGDMADAPLGSTVLVEIPDNSENTENELRVPVASVLDTGKGPGVWVVSGATPKTHWRPVTIQRLAGGSAYITSRISEGDRVVALGAHLMREGRQVRVEGWASGSQGSHR